MLAQNKNELIEQYLHLLGLTTASNIFDIKKAYRIMAKINHPDKFKHEDEKLRQSKIMSNITEVYRFLIVNFDKENKHLEKEIKENDYDTYKSGLYYYNKYFDTFFKLFSKRELITPQEKRECLLKAKSLFVKLVNDFPESSWIIDTNEKLLKIERALNIL